MKDFCLRIIGIILCFIAIICATIANNCENLCQKIDNEILTPEQQKKIQEVNSK